MSDISSKDFQFIDINTIQAERITAPRYSYWASVFRVFFRKKINIVLITLFIILIVSTFVILPLLLIVHMKTSRMQKPSI